MREPAGGPVAVTRRAALVGAVLAGAAACTGGSTSRATTPSEGGTSVPDDEAYGSTPRQHGQWWLPAGTGPAPTVVLVHGGYWRADYDLTLENAVAQDLAGRGYLVWNIDYAPSTDAWPATLTDVAAGYDFLFHGRHAGRVDPTRVSVVGHSAGGHLALWLASRARLPAGAPGAGPHRQPALAVGQAPVASLAAASKLGLGSGAVDAFVGGSPVTVPERYAVADPVALLPTGTRTVLVHGTADEVVPLSQSEDYLTAATRAGDRCTLQKVPGDHFVHLDPASVACQKMRDALAGT